MFYDNRIVVWIFRCSVFVGLLSAVVTVIYLTPVPELQHASCLRQCHELDWPMICRIKIVLDTATVVTRGTTLCPWNTTECVAGGCSTSGSQRSTILTANGLVPGPTIQVCEKDILVVDVVNRVAGAAMSVHWRGQSQRETPYMDGAPMVTQCPINSFSTFQYKFRASEPGTHLWQVQTGNEELDTLVGPLIVRQSPKKDPHHDLYDEDNQSLVISELPSENSGTRSAVLLINGLPSMPGTEPLPQLNITMNKRHRFRIIYSATSFSCPVKLTVDSHSLMIITIDGHPIRPEQVQSVKLAPGERVDVILTADQIPADYRLTAQTVTSCSRAAVSSALLTYTSPDSSSYTVLPHQPRNQLKELSTVGDAECSRSGNTGLLCLQKIQSLVKLPAELASERLDITRYLTFDFVKPPPRTFFGEIAMTPRVNNLTLSLPSSPLLSQPEDEDSNPICSDTSRPAHCDHGSVCQCLHVMEIPVNAAVELILINQGESGDNVFHLHGHSFHVVGATGAVGLRGVDAVKDLDRRGQLFPRNLKNPIVKDTVSVPSGGVVAIRFLADNPGYWLLRAERPSHWARGLAVILHVGGSEDVPEVPEKFPVCGSWVGPEFFLI